MEEEDYIIKSKFGQTFEFVFMSKDELSVENYIQKGKNYFVSPISIFRLSIFQHQLIQLARHSKSKVTVISK